MKKITIEGSTAHFNISEIGKNSGETFSGDFTVKCFLSPMDTLKADRLYRELVGEVNPHLVSGEVSNIAFALSQLKYRVVKSPAGWKNTELDGGHLDNNIIIDVLNKAVDAELEFRKIGAKRLKDLRGKLTKQIKEGEIKEETEELEEQQGE